MRSQPLRPLRLGAAALLAVLFLRAAPARAAEASAPPAEWAGPAYIVTGVGDRPLILDGTAPAPDFTGYPLTVAGEGQARDLAAAAALPITVRHHGRVCASVRGQEPFSALLRSLGAAPGPGEGVLVTAAPGHIELTVSSELSYYDADLETSCYQTIRRENPALKPGEERVVQVGRQGEKGVVYEVEWSNGSVTARHMVELLDNPPIDEIIEYGPAEAPARTPAKTPAQAPAKAPAETPAKAPAQAPAKAPAETSPGFVAVKRDADQKGGVLTLPSGEALRFSKSVSMTATAYTTGYDGVGTITASGTTVHVGVVAVDPKVIPLGTRLYIIANGGVIYGKAVAEDTGVRGNCVDLYMGTYRQCIDFGRRGCIAYILE